MERSSKRGLKEWLSEVWRRLKARLSDPSFVAEAAAAALKSLLVAVIFSAGSRVLA